jgi:hypothetical protein
VPVRTVLTLALQSGARAGVRAPSVARPRWARTPRLASVRRSTHRGPRSLHCTAIHAPSPRPTCRARRGHVAPTMPSPSTRDVAVLGRHAVRAGDPSRDLLPWRIRNVLPHRLVPTIKVPGLLPRAMPRRLPPRHGYSSVSSVPRCNHGPAKHL